MKLLLGHYRLIKSQWIWLHDKDLSLNIDQQIEINSHNFPGFQLAKTSTPLIRKAMEKHYGQN